MKEYTLGIDIGTSSIKLVLIEASGKVVSTVTRRCCVESPKPGWSESDPIQWWVQTLKGLKELWEHSHISPSAVKGVGLTGQMHGLVLLDKRGGVVRPCMLWNDRRATAECDVLTQSVGHEEIINITGSSMLPGIVAPKLAWVREHEARAYSAIAHVLLPKDYLRYRLSGEMGTDVTDASGTGLFDIEHRTWSDKMIDACGMPQSWFPQVVESQETMGRVNAESSEQTGLPVGTPITAGAGDQPAAGVGSGVVSEGVVSVSLGTSGAMLSQRDTYRPDPEGRVQTYCHAVPGKWQTMGIMLCAAGSVVWLSDILGMVYSEMDALAGSVGPGSDGLFFLPYLSGERAPYNDASARGSFVGLTLQHEAKHMIRAVFEGVAYGLRDSLNVLDELGVSFDELTLSGGGSRSSIWSTIVASTLAKELHYLPLNEGAAYGAALLATVGAGFYPSIETASKSTLHRKGVALPDPQLSKCYKQYYPLYRACYPGLKPIYDAL